MLVELGDLVSLRTGVPGRRISNLLHVEVVFEVGNADLAHLVTHVIEVHSLWCHMLWRYSPIEFTAATRYRYDGFVQGATIFSFIFSVLLYSDLFLMRIWLLLRGVRVLDQVLGSFPFVGQHVRGAA